MTGHGNGLNPRRRVRTNKADPAARRRTAVELLAGLAGAVPGAVLGHYAIWGPFGPYPDQMAMLTLITIPAGMVAGAFSGQAIARRVMDRRVMERRARQDSAP